MFFILVPPFAWMLSYGDTATAGYADSAHGNDSYGVSRSGAGHAKGNCAHCHETFSAATCGANWLMFFAPNNPTSQTDNFCLECHKGTGSVQADGLANQDYGATFGGGIATFTNIYDAFNDPGPYASSHDLATVKSHAENSDWGGWLNDNTSACLICHNVHWSQKNFPVVVNNDGGVNTAVRRGDDVNIDPNNLWGDEPQTISGHAEMMSDWTTRYQAPLRGDSGYEPGPAGSTVQDGSNLPNFVEFCAGTCHKERHVPDRDSVNWTEHSTNDWPGNPSRHGIASAIYNPGYEFGSLRFPYDDSLRGSYVLSCTDCHEPHGSTNATLLRTTVNGVSGLSTGGPGHLDSGGKWYDFCSACHDLTDHPFASQTASCGDVVGCHMFTPDPQNNGGDHGYIF
jgi:hypothetical protein